ncbi:MAG: Hpt domain-containing protein [Gammaproteobacteria bacterium]|jgi:chemotaxis protein histidine kinase CheA
MKFSQEEIEARLNAIRQDYLCSLQEKRDAIMANRAALQRNWDNDVYHALYLIVHSLAGSAETFGLVELTRTARSLVNAFKQYGDEHALPAEAFARCSNELDQLLSCLDACLRMNPAK